MYKQSNRLFFLYFYKQLLSEQFSAQCALREGLQSHEIITGTGLISRTGRREGMGDRWHANRIHNQSPRLWKKGFLGNNQEACNHFNRL